MSISKNFDFEFVFNSFYDPLEQIHAGLSKTLEIFPDEEMQKDRISQLTKIPGSFGFLVELDTDRITPVSGFRFPFDKTSFDNKQFCRYIHPSYLIPFLIFAKFAYETAASVKLSKEDLLNASYKIPVPLKLPSGNEYVWFIQKAFALTVNQNNQVISHINLYEFDRTCLALGNGEIENRFVEATLLVDNNLHKEFQGYMNAKINEYLSSLFQKQYKQWKMLVLLKEDMKQSNQSLATALRLTEETIKSYSKDILYKIRTCLGYQFVTLREAVASLSHKGYI